MNVQGFLSSDQIYDNFLPLCFQYMTENVLPVRTAAALALAVFIRYQLHHFFYLTSSKTVLTSR
jgi:serine/threonine-protein phosphatase 4 regulatory subunit 4